VAAAEAAIALAIVAVAFRSLPHVDADDAALLKG
jgi:NADH:ubiquinone oxidoreductase subunit K